MFDQELRHEIVVTPRVSHWNRQHGIEKRLETAEPHGDSGNHIGDFELAISVSIVLVLIDFTASIYPIQI